MFAPIAVDIAGLSPVTPRATCNEILGRLTPRTRELAAWNRTRTLALARDLAEDTRVLMTWLVVVSLLGLVGLAGLVVVVQRRQHVITQRIVKQEVRQRAIIEHTLDAIITIDDSQRIVIFNQAAERMFGWSLAEIQGQELSALIPSGDQEHHQRQVDQFIAKGPDQTVMAPGRRIQGRHRNGSVLPISVSLSRVDLDGQVFSTAVIRDRTEEESWMRDLRQARDVAEQASAAKSDFLATMSHEIRTPLNGVLGMLFLAQRERPLSPALAERLRIATHSAESLLQILNDTLDLARLEAGRLTFDPIPVMLAKELRLIHALFEARAVELGLTYRLVVAPEVPTTVRLDPLRLRQILANLLGNAVKFTRAGMVALEVTADPPEQDRVRLHFRVRDSGIGMTPEALERLYQPFIQAEAGTARRFGGTGLGLAIVKRLVDLQQGTIEVASSVGHGTCFTIQLEVPLATASEVPSVLAEDVPLPRWQGRVLVVDDEPVNRLVARGFLNDLGVTVFEAANGKEAVVQRQIGQPDLILMDIQMPEMDGVAALQAIRAYEVEHRLAPVPMVVLTGSVMPHEVERWRRLGFAEVLAKPIHERVLIAALSPFFAEGGASISTPPTPANPGVEPLDLRHLAQIQRVGVLGEMCTAFAEGLPERFRLLRDPGRPQAPVLHALSGAASSLGLRLLALRSQSFEARLARAESLSEDDIALLERLALEGVAAIRRDHLRS